MTNLLSASLIQCVMTVVISCEPRKVKKQTNHTVRHSRGCFFLFIIDAVFTDNAVVTDRADTVTGINA